MPHGTNNPEGYSPEKGLHEYQKVRLSIADMIKF